jgi:hypothetical protein
MIDVGRLSGQVSLVRGVVRDGRKIVSLLEVDFIDSHMNAGGLVSGSYAMSTAPSGELNPGIFCMSVNAQCEHLRQSVIGFPICNSTQTSQARTTRELQTAPTSNSNAARLMTSPPFSFPSPPQNPHNRVSNHHNNPQNSKLTDIATTKIIKNKPTTPSQPLH